MREQEERVQQKDIDIRVRETEMRQLEDRNRKLEEQVLGAQTRAADSDSVVDRLMERVATSRIAPQAVGNHFTITDLGRPNLPKFSGTRTLEAVNAFITALQQEFRVWNVELLWKPVNRVEHNEGLSTYAILHLEDAATTWGKHAFPISGLVQTWNMFQTKLKAAYEPADIIFQLRVKWQALRIGCDASVAMFNHRFKAIHLQLNLHDPQINLQL
jgi:hypothetical protein